MCNVEHDCIRLQETNYQEYQTIVFLVVLLLRSVWKYTKNIFEYKNLKDTVPIFREEFELPHTDIIGYYDGNELAAFTLAYKFKSVNSVWADQFAWNYKNKKLSLGHVANKSEIALYKKLGYDYFYLGESSDYKSKLQGYEISNFFDTVKINRKPTYKEGMGEKRILN